MSEIFSIRTLEFWSDFRFLVFIFQIFLRFLYLYFHCRFSFYMQKLNIDISHFFIPQLRLVQLCVNPVKDLPPPLNHHLCGHFQNILRYLEYFRLSLWAFPKYSEISGIFRTIFVAISKIF